MQRHITQKDGASISPAHAKFAHPASTGRTDTGQDLNHRAKLRALAEAMGGPCFVRFDDGRTAILSAEALQIVDIPLSHSTASSSEAKQYHA